MKSSRNRFERFCLKNRDKGIPNLMLYVAIGTFMVNLLANLEYPDLMQILMFDYTAILHGQVWRLFTFIFTMPMDIFTSLIFLYCFVSLGRAVESAMGTFKFNLYYLSGILLMDVFGMIFGGMGWFFADGHFQLYRQDFSLMFAGSMGFFLYLSLILCFSTLYPDSQFFLFFIIPIKAWLMSLFYLIYISYIIVSTALDFPLYPQCLFPLIGLANYFLFLGKYAENLLPQSWRIKKHRTRHAKAQPRQSSSIPFNQPQQKKEAPPPYTHRCTICGRTDLSNPELEFRYCSRCNGYFCYCQDHISNHTHVE